MNECEFTLKKFNAQSSKLQHKHSYIYLKAITPFLIGSKLSMPSVSYFVFYVQIEIMFLKLYNNLDNSNYNKESKIDWLEHNYLLCTTKNRELNENRKSYSKRSFFSIWQF